MNIFKRAGRNGNLRRAGAIMCLLAALCAGPARAGSVRRIDSSQSPEAAPLAEKARRIADEMYPKIVALLADGVGRPPEQFDLAFQPRLDSGRLGQTRGKKITLAASWFERNPGDLDMILIHEMTHVAQMHKRKAPVYWAEGLADYASYKFDQTNGWRCPQCTAAYPSYTSGYCCAGAFLLFLDATRGPEIPRRLNTALRLGSYSDAFFVKEAGRSLGDLWQEFQATTAFTPVAAEINKLRSTLGFVNGEPPKDVRARFEAYLRKQPDGPVTLEAIELLESPRLKDRLPGFAIGERGQLPIELHTAENPDPFPFSKVFCCAKEGDPSTYLYKVVRASQTSPWMLERAWRTRLDGVLIQEYSVQ
jgi:hypothetical protein